MSTEMKQSIIAKQYKHLVNLSSVVHLIKVSGHKIQFCFKICISVCEPQLSSLDQNGAVELIMVMMQTHLFSVQVIPKTFLETSPMHQSMVQGFLRQHSSSACSLSLPVVCNSRNCVQCIQHMGICIVIFDDSQRHCSLSSKLYDNEVLLGLSLQVQQPTQPAVTNDWGNLKQLCCARKLQMVRSDARFLLYKTVCLIYRNIYLSGKHHLAQSTGLSHYLTFWLVK